MPRILSLCVLCLAALLALAAPALAHRVNIFAYVDNGVVKAECFYSKSSRVNHGKVIVTDLVSGAELLRGETDENGAFSFPAPEAARAAKHGLKITLVAGEGHQNETEVAFEEFGAAPAAPASTWVSAPAAPAGAPAAPAAGGDQEALARLVEDAVARQISPLKRMLAQSQEAGPGPVEIVGGIGYIFGLFGVAAFMASRKKR